MAICITALYSALNKKNNPAVTINTTTESAKEWIIFFEIMYCFLSVKLEIRMNTKNVNKSEIIKQNKHKVVKY